MSTMQQLTFVKPYSLEWQEVRKPELIEAKDAIVRPFASTTCDLDQAIVRGGTPFEGPFAIGHECVAEVIDVGDQVTRFAPGDVVCVPWHIACGECGTCLRGLPASCTAFPDHAMFGHPVGGDFGGLFDDYVRVPFANNMLVKAPSDVNPHHLASFSDNVSIAWEVLKKHLDDTPGARILVMGGSASICLFVADVARALGGDVLYCDHSTRRLEIAARMGVKVHKGLPDASHGKFDIAIDASVDPNALRAALGFLKPEGICESVGIYFENVEFPMWEMYMSGVRFRIGRGNARVHMPYVLDLKARGCIHPEHAHTAICSYEEAPQALAASAKPLFLRDRITA
jgi:alcohol dehydrogenase